MFHKLGLSGKYQKEKAYIIDEKNKKMKLTHLTNILTKDLYKNNVFH